MKLDIKLVVEENLQKKENKRFFEKKLNDFNSVKQNKVEQILKFKCETNTEKFIKNKQTKKNP